MVMLRNVGLPAPARQQLDAHQLKTRLWLQYEVRACLRRQYAARTVTINSILQ
jgi:hypothetical protein